MRWFFTLFLAGAGVLLMAVSLPLIRGRVPPNVWYGVRLPATLADARVWYAVNARSGRDLLVLGAAVTTMALAGPVLPREWPPAWHALAVAAGVLVGVLLLAVRAVRHAGRLSRERLVGERAR